VECRDGPPQSLGGQTLIQAMENIGAAWQQRFLQKEPRTIGRQSFWKRAQKTVRPVAELEARFRMLDRQPEQHLAGI